MESQTKNNKIKINISNEESNFDFIKETQRDPEEPLYGDFV